MLPTTLAAIRARVDGTLVGDGATAVRAIRGIDEAGPGDLAFVRDAAMVARARASRAGAFLVPAEIPGLGRPQVVVADPVLALGTLLAAVRADGVAPAGIHPTAVVAPDARVGPGVAIGAHAVVGAGAAIGGGTVLHPHVVVGPGAVLGEGCVLHPHVTVREGVRLGARVRIDCGSAIGTDGFTVVVRPDGLHQLPQIGTVEIGDDVDIGSCVTIDRATLEATRIGRGVKIDNHSHIAHNVVVGDHSLLVAYAKIAGSTVLGRHVVVAEDVGITDNVTIGDGCRIGGGSRVFTSLPPGTEVWGHPARPLAEERKIQAIIARLPEMREQIRELRREKGRGGVQGQVQGKRGGRGKGKKGGRGKGGR